MRKVMVAGMGQTRVGELWNSSLRNLAAQALLDAVKDAAPLTHDRVQAVIVGNMLSGPLCGQENLGALVADAAGMSGVDAFKVEAACGSGGAALHTGFLYIQSGLYDTVAVVGVEKMTDRLPEQVTADLALASDGDFESLHGATFVALNALLMRLYMETYGYEHRDFANFCINAHQNALANPNAMFQKQVSIQDYLESPMVSDPICLMDASPVCDGAAAIILQAADSKDWYAWRQWRRDPSTGAGTGAGVGDSSSGGSSGAGIKRRPQIHIAGSALATDTINLGSRKNPLQLKAARNSLAAAMEQARITLRDINLFEIHDAFSIMAVLSLEACGLAEPGHGIRLAMENRISPCGQVPVATLGGLKSRGHPIGASGIYQVADVITQLRGQAGASQVPGAKVGLAQSVGGSGSSVTSHILIREEVDEED